MAGAKNIKDISVFVDESGSFDPDTASSRYYIVCMVFHDQSASVEGEIAKLNGILHRMNLPEDHAIHAGPLIRMEEPYRSMRREDRRMLFASLMAFFRNAEITYKCFFVDKKYITDGDSLHDALLQQIIGYLLGRAAELNAYDRIKIYYDNGQESVKTLLKESFSIYASKCEFVSEVTPSKYKLFQLADMICTLELLRIKLEVAGHISEYEKLFFLNIRSLRRNYLKPMLRKRA